MQLKKPLNITSLDSLLRNSLTNFNSYKSKAVGVEGVLCNILHKNILASGTSHFFDGGHTLLCTV